jgi:Bacteriophage A118-like holin, Hol118
MEQILAFATIIAVVVSMFVEMIKRTFFNLKPNWIPAISFVIGLIIGAVSYPFTPMDLVLRLWAGGIAGWMASGIYETVSRTKKL